MAKHDLHMKPASAQKAGLCRQGLSERPWSTSRHRRGRILAGEPRRSRRRGRR